MKDKERPLVEAVKNKVASAKEKGKAHIAKVKGNIAAKKATNGSTVTENRLELMVTIVNRSKAEYYADLIQSFDVNMQVFALASGLMEIQHSERQGHSLHYPAHKRHRYAYIRLPQ